MDNQRRNGVILPLNNPHNKNESIESLYANNLNQSISISDSLSVDSADLVKIQNKNTLLKDLVTSRFTAFLYFIKPDNPSCPASIKNSIKSIESLLISANDQISIQDQQKSFIIVSKALQDLLTLQKQFEKDQALLKQCQQELNFATTEEETLNSRLESIEDYISSHIVDKSKVQASCGCTLF